MGVSLTVRSSLMPEVWRGVKSGVEGGGVALSEGVSGATDEVEEYCGPAEVLGGLLVRVEVGMGAVLVSGLGMAVVAPKEGVAVDLGVDSGRGAGDGSVVKSLESLNLCGDWEVVGPEYGRSATAAPAVTPHTLRQYA